MGVGVHPELTVKVVEDTPDTSHLVLPVAPTNASQLSSEQPEEIAGGVQELSQPGFEYGGTSNI